MNTAAIYTRISHDPTGQTLGVTRQHEDCLKLAKRKGWKVSKTYCDNDISAWSGATRPAFEEMLADAQVGNFDAIIVYSTDRLYRRITDLERLVTDLHGVPVMSVASGDVDLSTADGQMLARIMGSVAQHESDKKSERSKRAARQRAERGLPPTGGARPRGWTSHARDELHPVEAPMLREAARRVLDGESAIVVAKDVGMTGPGLVKLLKNPVSAALSTYEGKVVAQGIWLPLWDVETHRRLVIRFSQTNARPAQYLLSKVLVCARCGTPMTGAFYKHRGGVRYYRCSTTPDYRGCGGTYVRADDVEAHVVSLMASALDGPALRESLTRPTPVDPQVAEELAALEDRRSRLAVDLANGLIDTATWKTVVDTLDPQIEERRGQLDVKPSVLREEDLADRVENLSVQTQARIARAVFTRIVVGEGRSLASEARLTPEWAY